MIIARICLFALAVSLLAGCNREPPKPAAVYPIKGTVLAVDPAKPSVKLDHEDIPGLMQAMKMEFGVTNAKVLEGLKVEDQVEGQLKVESGKYIIIELHKR